MEADSLHELSRRERECLALVGLGYRSGEIGTRLNLASGTVDNYIKAAARKTGISDRKLLARRLREYDPEGIQKLVQRLDMGSKSVAEPELATANGLGGVAAPGGDRDPTVSLIPAAATPRNGRSPWEKVTLALLIAIGTAIILRLLVYFSSHSLSDLPVLK